MNFGLRKKAAKLKSKQRIKRNKNREKRKLVKKSQVILHNDIPQDIVGEILSRLPVKSILRFKAVSKLWNSTISNPTFHRRCPAPRMFAMPYSYPKSSKGPHECYSMDEKGSIEKCPIPFDKGVVSRQVLSNSCNGSLLLSLGTSDIFLVNPSTHSIDIVLQLDDYFDKPETEIDIHMGFCYDESIGDYKAIIILCQDYSHESVLVASLREKQWTTIPIPSNFHWILLGPLLNDRLHITLRVCQDSEDKLDANNAILYFDPTKDVFEKVACPQPKSGHEDAIVGLGVLGDCLCVARRIGEDDSIGDVEFLVMKEYGVAESWTMLFVLKNLELDRHWGWLEPLFRTENGDILVKIRQKIYRYNLATNAYTKFTRRVKSGGLMMLLLM